MLSRVADAIYWLNRYVERAENIARFIDVNLNLSLDSPAGITQQWKPLVLTSGDLDEFDKRYGEATAENVIQFLTFDREYRNSIISCLQSARENARSIREIISSEMWTQINSFYLMVQDASQLNEIGKLSEFLSEVKLFSHLFIGVMNSTMSRNEGWQFGKIGRLLERADKTARILDVKYFILLPSVVDVGTTLDELQWIALLKSASAYEMYRKCQHRINPDSIAKFLILDRDFPRSIQFCLLEAEKSLYQINGNTVGTWQSPAERAIGKLRSDLEFTTIEDIKLQGLHEFLDRVQSDLNQIGDRIFGTFMAVSNG
jgi:uncharacterized alpha-E superfamily protein